MSKSETHEITDEELVEFGYGKGGVPWYLLLYYIAFLSLFTWYVLEFQLPDFLKQNPTGIEAPLE